MVSDFCIGQEEVQADKPVTPIQPRLHPFRFPNPYRFPWRIPLQLDRSPARCHCRQARH